MALSVLQRPVHRRPRKMRSRAFRESVLHLEVDRFCDSVSRFVARLAPARAAQAVEKIAVDVASTAIRLTPAVTGRARAGWLAFPRSRHAGVALTGTGVARGLREGSFRAELRGPRPYVKLVNAVPYIMPLEVGSRPHVIRPRRAKVLRFVARSGEVVFARYVRHPGTRAYRSLRHAYRHVRRHLERSFAGFQRGMVS